MESKGEYLIFGSTGYIGSSILHYLKILNKNFKICTLRLHEIEKIKEELDTYKPKYVINCAGLTGTPNIFWCEDNKIETIMVNVIYQIFLANLCFARGIHLTSIGSGGIFNNDKEYSENEEGNFKGNFYGITRIYLENIIKNFPNVLHLRINYPISSTSSNKNLITKLLSYKNVDQIEISITCMDNLIPILFRMIENNETGVCNFTNPGSITLEEILNIYNTLFSSFNNTHKKKIFGLNNIDESRKRSCARLITEKINKYNPLGIRYSIEECLKNYK